MRLAVIPARGGSKRVPRKNIRAFCGRPMIGWSLEAARSSGCFDRIVVSTDDDEIAGIARDSGALVPFRRPPELSDDHATSVAVVAHAVRWHIDNGFAPDAVCCLYPTAPFVRPEDLAAGLRLLVESGRDFAFPVTSYAFPIQRALRRDPSGGVAMLHPEHQITRSQDLEEAFHDAGLFYWGRPDPWLEERPIYGPASTTLLLPRHRVQDIDTPEDWRRAEFMFEAIRMAESAEAGKEDTA